MTATTKRQVALVAILATTGWLAGCSNSNRDSTQAGRGQTQTEDRSGQTAGARQGAQGAGRTQQIRRLETVATFDGPMPTGVTVSQDGRIFVNFPRWGDQVDFTVAEVVAGNCVAYPDEAINRPSPDDRSASLVSVQSVVVDPSNRLWILDTGSIDFGPTAFG